MVDKELQPPMPQEPISGGPIGLKKSYKITEVKAMGIELNSLPEPLQRELQRQGKLTYYEAHAMRMLDTRRSGVEQRFARALLSEDGLVYSGWKDGLEGNVTWKAENVILGDSANTAMAWTYMPYVFEELAHAGLKTREAFVKILYWLSQTSRELSNEPQIKYLTDFHRPYALAANPNDLSHRFTAQRAKFIANELLVYAG